MQITTIYYGVMIAMFLFGINLLKHSYGNRKNGVAVRYRMGTVHRAKRLYSSLTDTSKDNLFTSSGLDMSMRKYVAWRKLIVGGLIFVGAIKLLEMDTQIAYKTIIIAIGFYYLSYPKQSMKGRKTPFGHVLEMLGKKRAEQIDEELMGIIIQMKNIIISGNRELSANYILTRLLPFTKLSKPAFSIAIMHMRSGENEAVAKGFNEEFGTKLGIMFSSILMKLDELPASEFLEQLDAVQKKAEAEHKTRKEAKKVRMNTLKRLFATVEAVLIMGNFVYLILIDTLSIMNF